MRLKTLTKFLMRDMSLIAVECWYNGRAHYFKEYTKIDFPLTAFRYKNGAFEFFTDLSGFKEKLPWALSNWIKHNETKFKAVHTQMNKAIKYFESIPLNDISAVKDALNYLKKVCELFTHGFLGVLITHHLPLSYEEFKKKGKILFNEKLVKEIIKWRETEGNQFFNEAVEVTYFLLNKIADLMGWKSEDIYHLTLDELGKSINGNSLPIKIIEKRKKDIYLFFDDKVIYEKEITKILRKFNYILEENDVSKNVKEIKGTITNKGQAKGKIKIIYNRQQLEKLNKGDILVAPMTSPWYIQIMNKASAIITDEGGITCHASIIARELNKPCITGTRTATQILKDGDLVEVDANKGIVKKQE